MGVGGAFSRGWREGAVTIALGGKAWKHCISALVWGSIASLNPIFDLAQYPRMYAKSGLHLMTVSYTVHRYSTLYKLSQPSRDNSTQHYLSILYHTTIPQPIPPASKLPCTILLPPLLQPTSQPPPLTASHSLPLQQTYHFCHSGPHPHHPTAAHPRTSPASDQ